MLIINKFLVILLVGIALFIIHENLNNEKCSKTEKVVIFFTFITGAVISLLSLKELIILFSLLILFYCSYRRSKKVLYSISIDIASLLLFLVSDSFVNMFFYNLGLDYTKSSLGVLLYIILNLILCYMLSLALGRSIKFLSKNETMDLKAKALVVLNLVLSFFLILAYYTLCKVYLGFQHGIIEVTIFMLLILFLTSVIITTLLITNNFKKQLENELFKDNLKRMQEYSSSVEEMYLDIRKFKHDYINILISMREYIDTKDIDGLSSYFYKSIQATKDMVSGTDSISKLSNIKLVPIKALVSSKLIKADNLNIKTTVETEELYSLNIDSVDMIRILGIVLDNAIEGALESEERFINFGMLHKASSVLFVIENSCSKNLPPIYKLMENGFSTKGTGRGIGLSTLKELLGKYPNSSYNIENSNGIFKVELWFRNL